MTLTAVIMQFLAPPLVFIWLALLGLILRGSYYGRRCMFVGILLLWISSIPAVGVFLSRPLLATNTDWKISDLDGARAIVVTTGGYFPAEKRFIPEGNSLRRGDYGAWLHQQTGLPLLITGGSTFHPQAPAESVVLREQLGLEEESVMVEKESLNSYEHAVNLERGFREKDWDRKIVLVSSAMHMRRLSATFRAKGFEVFAVSVNDRVTWARDHMDSWKSFIPSSTGLEIFSRAFYSYAGILSYLAQVRFDLSDLFHDGPNYLAPPGPWLSLD